MTNKKMYMVCDGKLQKQVAEFNSSGKNTGEQTK